MNYNAKKLKKTYSERLKAVRLERKISVEQVCENTGLKKKRYLDLENGKALATATEMIQISLYLNVKNHYLCGLCDDLRALN